MQDCVYQFEAFFLPNCQVLKLAFVLKMLEILTFILNLIFKDMYIEEGQV